MMTPILRSLLFVPAIREKFIGKAPTSGADLICIDLEDSVPMSEKARGRDMARAAIIDMPRTGYLMCVRINSVQSGLFEADLDVVLDDGLDVISLPKVDSPEMIQRVDFYLTQLEYERNLHEGAIKIIPWIESALGLVNAYQSCKSSSRLIGAAVGGEDLTADLGVPRTAGGKEIEYARYVVATAAIAAGIIPLDTVYTDFNDIDGLRSDTLIAKNIGYKGKFCIHPSQIDLVNEIFYPSTEEITDSRAVMKAYEDGVSRGVGAVNLNGVMVDKPVYDRAVIVLNMVERVKRQCL